MGFTARFVLALFGIWNVWHFVWIVCTFWMSMSLPEQQPLMGGSGLIIWAVGAIGFLGLITPRVRGVERTLERLKSGATVNDAELLQRSRSCLNLPWHVTFLFFVFWMATCAVSALVWLYLGFGWLAVLSIVAPTLAGVFSLAAGTYATVGYLTGGAANELSEAVQRRGLELNGHRTTIGFKIIFAFLSYSFAYAAWMGFMAYYNGIDQIRLEMQRGHQEQLKWLNRSVIDRFGSDPGVRDLHDFINAAPVDADSYLFAVNREGKILHGYAGLYSQRWELINDRLRSDFKALRQGSLYDNGDGRVM